MFNGIDSLVCLVLTQFLSFVCAIYILIHCIKKKSTLRSLPNHLIICLLIVSTWMISIDLLSTEFYYWNGVVPIQTTWACRFYNVSFFSISGLNRIFMAFMSIERHFLVFRPQLYRARRSRFILHYLPIIIIILWSFTYSIVTDVFLTCNLLSFRYNHFLCGFTCSLLVQTTVWIYLWFQVLFPTVITIIACILLPIRFLLQKRKLQRLQWRRARKMIIQMSIIATAYTICWLPYTIVLHLVTANIIPLGDYYVSRFVLFDPYATSLLTPFICLHTIFGMLKFDNIKRIIRFCFSHRRNTVQPRTTVMTQNQNRITNQTNNCARRISPIRVDN